METNEDELKSSLIYILTNAGNAHQVYEKEVLDGKRDEDWANWYADYLVKNGINEILDTDFTRSEMENVLRDAADEQKKVKSKLGWSVFYYEYIIKRVNGGG